mgnify:FL=1
MQITHLTNQKDQDRLLLLKEVAGTKIYEERRAESAKIIEETSALLLLFDSRSTVAYWPCAESKREKIDDLLTFINERLAELEEEKEELKEFQVCPWPLLSGCSSNAPRSFRSKTVLVALSSTRSTSASSRRSVRHSRTSKRSVDGMSTTPTRVAASSTIARSRWL